MGKVQDTATFIKNAWDAVEEMGGDVPAQNKNLANLTAGIASIPQGPAVPTSLEQLKKMVKAGREIVVGTEIPDDYSGQSNPLIVVAYLDGTNSAYKDINENPAKGVLLQRSFITDVGQQWNNASDNNNYQTSSINIFLNGNYLDRCSQALKDIISDIKVPTVIAAGETSIQTKWFLPSLEEVYGQANPAYASGAPGVGKEGNYYPYWKTKTKLSAPSNDDASGRIVNTNSSSGNAGSWWLRTRSASSAGFAWYVTFRGGVAAGNNVTATTYGVLPACFIGKD